MLFTADGKVVTGIPGSRTNTDLALRTADDKHSNIRINKIDEESDGTSLTPTGLADPLFQQELVDPNSYLLRLVKEDLQQLLNL